MLHIVNKPASTNSALQSAIRHAGDGALLLIEDAVYAVARGDAANAMITEAMAHLKFYALTPDLEARGIAERVLDGVRCVGYDGFVDLVVEHPNNQSWL